MEKTNFMEKPIMLALSSQQYIKGLWKIGTEVSSLYAPITLIFSSIFNTLAKAVLREVSFYRVFCELYVTRFTFLPPYNLGIRRVAQTEEEYIQAEMGRANVSFLLNVILARKMGVDLGRRVAEKAPEPAFLPTAELTEGTMEKPFEEPARAPNIVADLQSRFESKLAPSIKGMTSAMKEYSKQTILTIPLIAMPRLSLVGPAKLEALSSRALAPPMEKEGSQVGVPEGPMVGISPVPAHVARLSPEAVRSFAYAAALPSIVLEQEAPILKTATASHLASPPSPKKEETRVSPPKGMLTEISHTPSLRYEEATVEPRRPGARLSPEAVRSFGYSTELSRIVSGLEVTMPSYPKTPMRAPMPTSQISLPEGLPPSPTSRTYEESQTLRSTAFSLSAVQVAASAAQRIVAEALIQPISLEASWTMGTQELISTNLPAFRPKARIEQIGVEAIRLQEPITSTVAAYSQRYGPAIELALIAPEEEQARETKRPSKLQATIALAATESSIAQRLQQQFTALISEMQATRSPYGETLAELGAIGPARAAITREPAAAPALSRAFQHYFPNASSTIPPSAGPSPATPTIQNTFNITIAAESMEEDFRDLESKISKILSEQIRRYYGSMRI